MVQGYLDYKKNPNLKLGEIREYKGYSEAEIVTKKQKAMVDRVIINKNTGRMRSMY